MVSIDVAPGTNPYLRAVADRFSFKANSSEVVEIPAKGLLQNDVLPSLGAYDRFQIGIVDAPLDVELSIKKDGSFSFLPPASPFSFTYSLTYNENKVSYARVKMIPFELKLQLDSPSNIVPLDGDDDNKNDRPDYGDDEERSSPDDDWVRLRVDTNLTSDQEVLVRARPEHVRLWHRNEDTGQYVLLEGRTPVRNLASVYLQGKALHSEEILVFGSIADEWEEVVGASPKIHVNVVSHEMVVPAAITVDEALQEGVRGTILFRGNSEVDWEAFSRSFPSRISIYDRNEAKLATLPLEISEWGIAEFQFMLPPAQLYHPNLFGAQRFRFELEYGQQTHRTVSETIVLPGTAKSIRLGGQVLQYLGDNVARQVDQFLLLDEIYHQPTRSPNFATFVDPSYFVSLYLTAADQAGNVLYGSPYRSIPVGLEWNGMTDNRAKSIVKHFDSPTSKEDEIGIFGGAVLVNMLPAASLPLVSQVKVSVDGTSRTVPFSGGSLQIGWDQSNPSEILFDQPSTIRLRIFAPHAPEGAVVEWSDSKGFLGDTTTSTVQNGVSSIDFALPFYGLSASLNALGPVYVQARIAGYEASGVVNVRHSLPLRYLLNVTGRILGADIDGTVTPSTQIALPTTATVNTGNEWNDLNVAVAAPTVMHSVAAKQSIKIRGLEPSRQYRAKITGDSHGLFLLEGGLSSERSENGALYFTPDARLEDVQIDIVSTGAFPDYRRGSFTAVRVEVEEEVAFRAYEAYADTSFPSPPTLIAEAVWAIDEAAGFPRMRMLFDSLFQNNPFVNVDLLMATVQRMRSDIYADSIAPIRSYEYYTPVGLSSASSPSGSGTPLTMSFDFLGTSALTAARLGQLQGVSREVFYGAVAGSDQLDMAFVGDLGLSAIPIIGAWSDIRDIGKNVARLAPVDMDLGPFDWRETTIASVGLIGEVLPPADWLVDSFRILYRVAKVSVKAMPFFLAVEPLFTDAFVKILLHQAQANSGSVPASGGSTGFGLQQPFNASALRGFLSENGIAHVEELVSLVELILTCVGNADLRRIVIRTTICSPNAAAAKSLVRMLEQFSVPEVSTILRQIAPTTDEFDTRILHRALDTYSQISRSKGDLRKSLQQLSAEETGEVLRRFGRMLATDVSYNTIPRETGLGVHLLIRLLKEMEAQSFLSNGNAVTNLRNLAEDLETIALGVERGLANQEELVWVMHKLGVNHGSGTQNGMYGALYELSGMADIMRRLPPGANAQLELTRRVSWDTFTGKEIWTDQDVVDKLSGTVYEMKTSLAAAKKKISSESCLPNAESIAGLASSNLFYKLLIHMNSSKDTGFTVIVGDLQGQSIMQTTRDLKNDISQCAKQFGLQGERINKMLSLISIRYLPVRYKM